MDSRQLTAFLNVSELGSFTAAGEALYISKVAVMKQISSLEGEVGAVLFRRTNQGCSLTEAGTVFYTEVKKIVRSMELAIEKTRAASGDTGNVIRIGTSILRPAGPLLALWAEIMDRIPNIPAIQFEMLPFRDDPHEQTAVIDQLGEKIDCFVSPCDSTRWRQAANILILKRISCRIAVSAKNPLAKKAKLTWEDLSGQDLMLIGDGDSPVLSRMRDEILQKHPEIELVDIKNKYDLETFNLCEKEGRMMESLDIWENVHPGIRTLPMDWDYEMPYGIVYAKAPSPVLSEFIGRIETYLSSCQTSGIAAGDAKKR